MFDFDSFQDQQEILTQKLREASLRMRDVRSLHLRVEGARIQNQEIQAIQALQVKIICSFKD